MFRQFVPSRELHSLAMLVRLSFVDLPSANSMKCCSPLASLKLENIDFGGHEMKKIIYALLVGMIIFTLCACSQNKHSTMYIKPSELSDETMEVLDLFDDEIQFFDISLDENVKSFEISVWVYRDGEWFEDGKTHGNNDFLGKRIAIRLIENSYELYNISDNGHEKYSYPSLDTPFEESMGIGYSKIDREIPIELNKEIPICVKIGTSSNRMEVLDITEDFRKIECDAGIAVTITVSDEIVE